MTDREGRVISLPIEGRPTELKVIHVHERPEAAPAPPPPQPRPWNPPVAGALAAVFGTAALCGKATLLLAPLAILFSLCALAMRHWLAVIRRAVGDSGQRQQVIKTMHGRGYRFVASLSVASSAAG